MKTYKEYFIDFINNRYENLELSDIPSKVTSIMMFWDNFESEINIKPFKYDKISEGDVFDVIENNLELFNEGFLMADKYNRMAASVDATKGKRGNSFLLTSLGMIKLKGERFALPINRRIINAGDDNILVDMYGINKLMEINCKNIEKLNMITLTSIRQFKRVIASRLNCRINLCNYNDKFNSEII